MATAPICLQRFYSSLYSYILVFGSIFLWMVVTMVLYECLLRDRIRGAPHLDAQFFGLTGTASILGVIVALIYFRPVCECSISCPSYIVFWYLVPCMEILVGLGCWVAACQRRNMAYRVSNDVFSKVPTEMELTEVDEDTGSDSNSIEADPEL